jgi:hypothetical protein
MKIAIAGTRLVYILRRLLALLGIESMIKRFYLNLIPQKTSGHFFLQSLNLSDEGKVIKDKLSEMISHKRDSV